MLGKLSIKDIPYHEPIIVNIFLVLTVIIFTLIFYISYKRRWVYLWKEWLTSLDHKKIGIMYIIVSFLMLFRGFADAIMMRAQQAITSAGGTGFLSAQHYDQIITAHGVIMIIFMATPLIIGIINFIIPLQIGARDVAFPFLNSLSFWLFIVGVVLINLSLFLGEFAQTGWTAYPPLSEISYSPGVGVDYWIWSIQISGIGTTLTGINFITTILKMKDKNMSLMSMPVFTWTVLCASVLIVSAFPILTVTIALLTLDRYVGTHFFTNDMGGNMMMYINLFWAWGHPEVYILILPIFGIFSEVVSTFSRKKIFGYNSLIWATIAITILSFCVWLHHFFTMGSGANVNAFFGIMTMIIAIPTGVKVFNWIFTIYQGKLQFHSSILWTLGFIITFSIGGMAGVLLSVPGADFVLHNSLFLVAHFHNVIIGGVVFGCFAGINYWFPKAFGFLLDEKWGKYAFYFWTSGFYFAFIPLYLLGFMGMTRRLSHNIDIEFHNMLMIAFFGVILISIGIVCQVIQFLVSIINRKKNPDNTGDPWNGRTLEWFTTSPPPVYNFINLPNINNTLDAFWYIKQGKIKFEINNNSDSIFLPKSTSTGIIISFFCLIFGFSCVWHIWWLAILGFVGIIISCIYLSFIKIEHLEISKNDIMMLENHIQKLYKNRKFNE